MGNYLSSLLCSCFSLYYTKSSSTNFSLTDTESYRGARDLAITRGWSRVLGNSFSLTLTQGRKFACCVCEFTLGLSTCVCFSRPFLQWILGSWPRGRGSAQGNGHHMAFTLSSVVFLSLSSGSLLCLGFNLPQGQDERLFHLLLCVKRNKRWIFSAASYHGAMGTLQENRAWIIDKA